MTVKLDPNYIKNLQSMEVAVSGPEGANRLFIVNGTAQISLAAASNGNQVIQKETFTLLVGPALTRKQFYRATASAFLTNTSQQNPGAGAGWLVETVDADWDDESKQVELRAEIQVFSIGVNNTFTYANVSGFGFQVNILAAIDGD